MNPITLRAFGIGMTALGALILAFRVKNLLDALITVAKFHEENIKQLTGSGRGVVQFVNSTKHVEKAQKLGTKLLFFGFFCIVIGSVLNAVSLFLH
jgi:hypothetical protein